MGRFKFEAKGDGKIETGPQGGLAVSFKGRQKATAGGSMKGRQDVGKRDDLRGRQDIGSGPMRGRQDVGSAALRGRQDD